MNHIAEPRRRRYARVAWLVIALATLVAAGALAAWLLWGLPEGKAHITIDGLEWLRPPAHAGHWLLATAAVLIVPLVMLLCVALPLLLVLLVMALALFLVGGLLAMIASPLLLLLALGWGVWWGLRRSQRSSRLPSN